MLPKKVLTFLIITSLLSFSKKQRTANLGASILITEIMYNPNDSESKWEWIEVYNNTSEAINLNGYVIDDNNSSKHAEANITGGFLLPKTSGVLYNADATDINFLDAWGVVNLIPVSGWSKMTLNNGGDTIGIWDSFSNYNGDHQNQLNVIEQVTFQNNRNSWPQTDNQGSIYLVDINADNTVGENWRLSVEGVSTPVNITYKSFNEGGNSGEDIGSPGITGIDEEPPLAKCKPFTLVLSEMGEAQLTPFDINDGSRDNVEIASMQISREVFSCEDLGENKIELTVVDTANNKSICEALVTVVDESLPEILCPENVEITSENSNPLLLNIIQPSVIDNCNIVEISEERSDGLAINDPFPLGVTTILWKATDSSGNSSTCAQEVNIVFNPSTEKEIISFSIQNQIGETIIDKSNFTIKLTMPFGTDVTNLSPIFEISNEAESLPTSGEIVDFSESAVFQITAEDKSIQEWKVVVVIEEDNTIPVVFCPEDIWVNAGENLCGAVVNYEVVSNDNQSNKTIKQIEGLESGAVFPIGETHNVFEVTDASENVVTCSFIVTVVDTTKPSLICKNYEVSLDSNGNAILSTENLIESYSDNCEVKTISASKTLFTTDDLGENTVVVKVADASGNETSCEAIVKVNRYTNYSNEIWLEAECAEVGRNWKQRSNSEASGFTYLQSPLGNKYTKAPTNPEDIVSFKFSANKGLYRLYALVNTPSVEDDSFWIRVNNGEWLKWNNIPGNGSFAWRQVHEKENVDTNIVFKLIDGENSIEIGHREDGASLDKILIKAANEPDDSLSQPVSCGVTSTIHDIIIEAECADIGDHWAMVNEEETEISYLRAPSGNNFTPSTNKNDIIKFNFTAAEGVYKIYGLIKAPTGEDDSFWIRVNNEKWLRWNNIPKDLGFKWNQVHDRELQKKSLFFNLIAGENTIEIGHREDGISIDKIYIQAQNIVLEGLGGEDKNCISPKEPNFPENVWLEAECAIIGSNWMIESSVNASNSQYVLPPLGFSSQIPSTEENVVKFNFEVAEGTYKVYARTLAPTLSDDSFYVRINNGNWLRWNNISKGETFTWNQVHDRELVSVPLEFDLQQGLNTIEIGNREDGVGLDKLFITKKEEIPNNFGEIDLSCESNQNIFLAKRLETDIRRLDDIDLKLVPNPASEMVTLSFNKPVKFSSGAIFDIHGRLVQVISTINNPSNPMVYSININTLQPGLYYVNIIDVYGTSYEERLLVK